jgi:hypothetical protein
MIEKQFLLNKLVDNNIKGLIYKVLDSPIERGNYKVQNSECLNYLELRDGDNKILLDDLAHYITEFTPELLDKEFTSILIGGLGLGIIPLAVQNFCTTVDVIENSTDIIEINTELDVLNSNVSVIEGDIFTFQPTKTYDVIVMDIWYRPTTVEEVETLNSIYLPFVNEGGFLYYPINTTSKEEHTVIVNK